MKIKFLFMFLCALLVSASVPFVSAAPVEMYRFQGSQSFLMSNEWISDGLLRSTLIILQKPTVKGGVASGSIIVHVAEYQYGSESEEGRTTFSATAFGQLSSESFTLDQNLSTASVTNVVLNGQKVIIDEDGQGTFAPAQFTVSFALDSGAEKIENTVWQDSYDFGCLVYRFSSVQQQKNTTPVVLSLLIDGSEMFNGSEVVNAWIARTLNMFILRTTKDECSF